MWFSRFTIRRTNAIHNPQQNARRAQSHKYRVVLGIAAVIMVVAVFALSPLMQRSEAYTGQHPQTTVRGKKYYLALGDSLAFGFQPNGDDTHGYVQQWSMKLQSEGSQQVFDYGCPGASTQDFVAQPGTHCIPTPHVPYMTSQLEAAVHFIQMHPHQVSPVSLDIGSSDLVQAIAAAVKTSSYPPDCTVDGAIAGPAIDQAVTTIQQKILPPLVKALTAAHSREIGDLILMNLYDPLQNVCPATVPYIKQFNQKLAAVAATFHLVVVDVFTAFGGDGVGSPYPFYNPHICTYTWYTIGCPGQQQPTTDIHPTTLGYGVIATAFQRFVRK